jgi:hypothetical protein
MGCRKGSFSRMKNTQTNVGSFAAAKLQAKRRGLLAIIVIAAVIGFAMTACDDSGPVAKSITITGIPSQFNGKDAMVSLSDNIYVALGGPEEISGGSVTFPLKKYEEGIDPEDYKDWTGSGPYYVTFGIADDGGSVTYYIYVADGMPEKLGITAAITTITWDKFEEMNP